MTTLTIGMKLYSEKTNKTYIIESIDEAKNKAFLNCLTDSNFSGNHILDRVVTCVENGYYEVIEEVKTQSKIEGVAKMKKVIKEHNEYILCQGQNSNGSFVIIHFVGKEYFGKPYYSYNEAQKHFKAARDFLGVKRLYETTPIGKERFEQRKKEGVPVIEC